MTKDTTQHLPAPIFFNFVQINATPDVVNFNIGIRAESTENPALIARLMTTPQFSKIFLSALAQMIASYEDKFGEIKTPGINSEELQARIRALCTLSNETLN